MLLFLAVLLGINIFRLTSHLCILDCYFDHSITPLSLLYYISVEADKLSSFLYQFCLESVFSLQLSANMNQKKFITTLIVLLTELSLQQSFYFRARLHLNLLNLSVASCLADLHYYLLLINIG